MIGGWLGSACGFIDGGTARALSLGCLIVAVLLVATVAAGFVRLRAARTDGPGNVRAGRDVAALPATGASRAGAALMFLGHVYYPASYLRGS